LPVDGTEVQEQASAAGNIRGREGAPVPQAFGRAHTPLHSAEIRFDGKRYEDGPLPIGYPAGFLLDDSVLPRAVQVDPGLTRQLRPGIFGPRIIAVDQVRPWSLEHCGNLLFQCPNRPHEAGLRTSRGLLVVNG